jgi:tetratricopeptide (TPR) repeat protein
MYLVRSFELNQDGKNPETQNLLGLCYYELGDYAQANNIFNSMLEKYPLNTNLLLNSARCLEKLGDKDMTLSRLDKTIEIFPECEEAHEMLRRLS